MPTFEVGDLVRVPFPFTDGDGSTHRPAVVVAVAAAGFVLWVLMVTGAENRPWPGDLEIPEGSVSGLPGPSVIRTAKIATVEHNLAERRGRIDPVTMVAVRESVFRALAPLHN